MLDRDLKCSCNRYAYADAFSGEYGEGGYTCSSCLKALNKEVVERWHANNAEHTNRVPKGNTERGLRDLNQMINPVLKLGKNG